MVETTENTPLELEIVLNEDIINQIIQKIVSLGVKSIAL